MSEKKPSRKQFLKGFDAVTDAWLQANGAADNVKVSQVIGLRETLANLLAEKLKLDEQQNVLKGALGRAKKAGESPGDLIDRMRESADKLKSLNIAVNSTADLLSGAIFEEQAQNSEKLCDGRVGIPEHFLAPRWTEFDTAQPDASVGGQLGNVLDSPVIGDASTRKPATVAGLQISENLSDEQWASFAASHAQATHYHQHPWRKIIADNFPQQHWHVGALNEAGGVDGVMSLVHMNSPVSGNYLLSMPWLIYGGSVSSSSQVSDLLAGYAKTKMSELGCTHVELRQIQTRPDWQPMPGKAAMMLALPATSEELNANFHSSLRAQVRSAASYGPSIEFGGVELVSDFYAVFCEKMRDLGTPVYHKKFFTDIARTFPDSTTVVVVYMDGQAVAAAFLVKHKETVEIPWAAARKKYNRQAVNMFMYHQILEYSIAQSFRYFDFGRSTVNTGTYQFKKQWGAKPQVLGWHRWPHQVDNGGSDDPQAVSFKFRMAIAVWKKLPVWVTRIIGPPVSRLLPW